MDDAQPAPNVTAAKSFIRAVERRDVPALKVIVDRSGLFSSDLLDDMLAGYLNRAEPNQCWLTSDDGDPVAIAFCAPEPMTEGTWNLYLIAVNPDRRSQGHGAALLRHLEDALRARGHHLLLAETSGAPDFERTRAFYTRNGYEREARIRDFYEPGDDKIVFRKSLRRP